MGAPASLLLLPYIHPACLSPPPVLLHLWRMRCLCPTCPFLPEYTPTSLLLKPHLQDQLSLDEAPWKCSVPFWGSLRFLPNMTPRKCSLPHAGQLPRNLSVTCHQPQPRRRAGALLLPGGILVRKFTLSRALPFPALPKACSRNHPDCGMYSYPTNPFIIIASLLLASKIIVFPCPSSSQTQSNTPHSSSKIAILV